MLAHNAPHYVGIAIESLQATSGLQWELVVVDNASEVETQELLTKLAKTGSIHQLVRLEYNSLFAEGNNIAASRANPLATHFLLLNSDVEIRDPEWLRFLLKKHESGITSFGAAFDPTRVDGYCLLVDAQLYRERRLDEGHQWWWGVTKFQAQLLRAGYPVTGYLNHEKYLHHFGGMSGSAFKAAKGMQVTRGEAAGWFGGKKPVIRDTVTGRKVRRPLDVGLFANRVVAKLKSRLLPQRRHDGE